MPENPDAIVRIKRSEIQEIAESAALKVGAIHRRRLVTQTALVTFTVSFIIFLVIGLLAKDSVEDAARNANQYACHITTAESTILGEFIGSDATLRYRQGHLKVSEKLIADLHLPPADLKGAVKQSARLNTRYADKWYFVYQPALKSLGQSSCNTLNGR